VTMPLHVAADHGPVEHVERRKERGGAVALIITGRVFLWASGPSALRTKPIHA
jgi:hypothetical protein